MSYPVSIFRVSDLPATKREICGTSKKVNIWQTIEWNAFILKSGYETEWFVVQSESLFGIFEKRSIGLGQYWLFCIGGPVMKESSTQITQIFQKNSEEWLAWLESVKSLAIQEKVVFIQMESLEESGIPGYKRDSYKKFIEPYTIVIDLDVSEEEILAQMKEKGRYNIRLAEKRGVVVEQVKSTKENLEIFLSLFEETLSRDGFSGNSRTYYQNLLDYLERENIGSLFLAKNASGVPIAAAISVFVWENALYYYGASTSDATLRRDMGAYLIQWKMILEAKHRSCKTYDFLGIAPEWSTGHHLEGVTDFKKKFGGRVVKWPDAHLMVIQKGKYFLLQMVRTIKKLFRK